MSRNYQQHPEWYGNTDPYLRNWDRPARYVPQTEEEKELRRKWEIYHQGYAEEDRDLGEEDSELDKI